MDSFAHSSPARSDHPSGDPAFARLVQALDLESLRGMLRVVQLRLGTALEQEGDVERAQILGHGISNKQTVERMRTDLAKLGQLPPATQA
jgi:hypothetical protein